MKTKRLLLIMMCLGLVLSAFSGCAGRKTTVLTVGEAEVNSEIFAYFFNKAYSAVEAEGGNLLDRGAITDDAIERCGEYVSSITLFEQMNLSLNADEKLEISQNVEEEWHLYGGYYESAGISKQTVAKIERANAMRTALLLYYFGEGSEYEVGEDEIEYYFDQTYVQFQAINGYLTTTNEQGETIRLSEEEAAALRADFESKKQKLESGVTLRELNDGVEVDPTFAAVSNQAYPDGFLEQVAKLEENKPAIIEVEDYIFLVIRQDAKEGEENYYNSYRTDYIEALRGEMLTDMLVATMEDYEIIRNEQQLEKAADRLIDARNERKKASY